MLCYFFAIPNSVLLDIYIFFFFSVDCASGESPIGAEGPPACARDERVVRRLVVPRPDIAVTLLQHEEEGTAGDGGQVRQLAADGQQRILRPLRQAVSGNLFYSILQPCAVRFAFTFGQD